MHLDLSKFPLLYLTLIVRKELFIHMLNMTSIHPDKFVSLSLVVDSNDPSN